MAHSLSRSEDGERLREREGDGSSGVAGVGEELALEPPEAGADGGLELVLGDERVVGGDSLLPLVLGVGGV